MTSTSKSIVQVTVFACVLFLSPLVLSAQALLSEEESLSYYPLGTGSVWQYNVSSVSSAFPYREVVGDSLMENGHRYQVIKRGWAYPYRFSYERIDTTSMTVYSYERGGILLNGEMRSEYPFLLLPKKAQGRSLRPDSTGYLSINCNWILGRQILGESRQIWRCLRDQGIYWFIDEMTAEMGVVYKEEIYEHPLFFHLSYVRVGGNEAGIRVGREHQFEFMPATTIEVYPLPAKPGSALNINGINSIGPKKIEVFDVWGRSVDVYHVGQDHSAQVVLSSNLSAGTYFLVVTHDHVTQSASFIVTQN